MEHALKYGTLPALGCQNAIVLFQQMAAGFLVSKQSNTLFLAHCVLIIPWLQLSWLKQVLSQHSLLKGPVCVQALSCVPIPAVHT